MSECIYTVYVFFLGVSAGITAKTVHDRGDRHSWRGHLVLTVGCLLWPLLFLAAVVLTCRDRLQMRRQRSLRSPKDDG